MFMKKKYLLIIILLLSAILRLWRLDSYPALNADEAAIGYNAYSLLLTGKDEHGNSWPIHFQSFNDYKPGLYFYIVAPFVGVFGLNEWVVRLPGAMLGVTCVYLVYLLVKELFKDEWHGIVASLFLAISPWHIHFSRGGWEVNVSTFFILLGVYLFFKGLKNTNYFFLSMVSFILSLYTYHAARIVVPALVLGLLIIYKKEFAGRLKEMVVLTMVGLVLLTPLVKDVFTSGVISRAAGVGLFADPGPLARINEQRGEHTNFTKLTPRLLHNKAVNYSLAFLENWSEHYWGEFLFLSGDEIQRNRVPETGQMYLFDLIFIFFGFLAIVKTKRDRKEWAFILLWLAGAPIAAALTFQSPHALRAHNMVIPLIIISSYGLVMIIRGMDQIRGTGGVRKLIFVFLALTVLWNFVRYQRMYWLHMAKEYPFSSQYGVKELVDYVKDNQDKFEKVIVTDRYDQPYVLFLFYMEYPPSRFQNSHELTARDGYGFSTVREFDKYRFYSINYDTVQPENPGSLIVGTDSEIPDEANIIGEIYGINGYKYFQIVAN